MALLRTIRFFFPARLIRRSGNDDMLCYGFVLLRCYFCNYDFFFFLLGIPLAGGQDETSIYFVKYFRRRVLVVCFQASLSLEERRTEIFEHSAGRCVSRCQSVSTSKLVARISV
jgi:hypothetical protein